LGGGGLREVLVELRLTVYFTFRFMLFDNLRGEGRLFPHWLTGVHVVLDTLLNGRLFALTRITFGNKAYLSTRRGVIKLRFGAVLQVRVVGV
jgi:hypothetical protein